MSELPAHLRQPTANEDAGPLGRQHRPAMGRDREIIKELHDENGDAKVMVRMPSRGHGAPTINRLPYTFATMLWPVKRSTSLW